MVFLKEIVHNQLAKCLKILWCDLICQVLVTCSVQPSTSILDKKNPNSKFNYVSLV